METGVLLEQDLVAYRKTLRSTIGDNHPDYQKLRLDRVRTPDEDDDEVAAALPEDLSEETEGEETNTTPPIDTQPADQAPASP